MKKTIALLLAIALICTLFIGCASEPENAQDQQVMAYLDRGDLSRSLNVTNPDYDYKSYDNLYWFYTAVKTDGGFDTGKQPTETPLNGGNKGLPNEVGPFSVGAWKFVINAYTDANKTTKYFSGVETPVILSSKNRVIKLNVSLTQAEGSTGTLLIKNVKFQNKTYEDVPSLDAYKIFVQIDDQEAKEDTNKAVVAETGYSETLAIGSHKVIVSLKNIAADEIVSSETLTIKVQANLTTTIDGSVVGDTTVDGYFDVSVWDGSIPTEKPASYVEEGNQITLNDASALVYFMNSLSANSSMKRVATNNTFEGYTIKLNTNINLQKQEIKPISVFKGTFDGNGYTISGFKNKVYTDIDTYQNEGNAVVDNTRTFSAFIEHLDGGTLKNVTFENYEISAPPASTNEKHRYMAVAVGMIGNGATIDGVIVKEGNLISPVRAAGICSYIKNTDNSTTVNTIKNSSNYANVTSTFDTSDHGLRTFGTAAGILSTTGSEGLLIENCKNFGEIKGYVVGGIVGDIQHDNSTIKSSTNEGPINAIIIGGGILGDYWWNDKTGRSGSTITDCKNTGTIQNYYTDITKVASEKTTNNYDWEAFKEPDVKLGGIVGFVISPNRIAEQGAAVTAVIQNQIKNSSSSGDITAIYGDYSVAIGGIAGYVAFGNIRIEGCTQTGTLTNRAECKLTLAGGERELNKYSVGGIIGSFSRYYVNIVDSYGTGNYVVPEGCYAGAIAGRFMAGEFFAGENSNPYDNDGNKVDVTDENKVKEVSNSVTFSTLTEVKNPFGILSTAPYSKYVKVENLKADTLRMGGSSKHVYDTAQKNETLVGEFTYDLTGSEIATATRDCEATYGELNNLSTVKLKGGTIGILQLFKNNVDNPITKEIKYHLDGATVSNWDYDEKTYTLTK